MGEYFSRLLMMIQSDGVNIMGEYMIEIIVVGYCFDCMVENIIRFLSYSEVDEGYQYYMGFGVNVFVSFLVYSEKLKDLWNVKFVVMLLKNFFWEVDMRKDGCQFFYDVVWKLEQGCIDVMYGIEV